VFVSSAEEDESAELEEEEIRQPRRPSLAATPAPVACRDTPGDVRSLTARRVCSGRGGGATRGEQVKKCGVLSFLKWGDGQGRCPPE